MMKRIMIAMAALLMMSGIANAQGVRLYAGIGLGAFGLETKNANIGFNQKIPSSAVMPNSAQTLPTTLPLS